MNEDKYMIIFAGIGIGLLSVFLVYFNITPFYVSCFLRDISASLGFCHIQGIHYPQPVTWGLIIGSFFATALFKEIKTGFNKKNVYNPMLMFILGIIMMIGALLFMACPMGMIYRIARGDLNALLAVPGYILGIFIGVIFINNGFSLKNTYSSNRSNVIVRFISYVLFIFLIAAPIYILFKNNIEVRHYLWGISIVAGIVSGFLFQRSRLCTMGAIRNYLLIRNNFLGLGILAFIIVIITGYYFIGMINFGFADQPRAHTDFIWNIIGMFIVGLSSVFAEGCPLRHIILAGEGQLNSLITVFGMITGASISFNFGIAASVEGVGLNGVIAASICVFVLLSIGVYNSRFFSVNELQSLRKQ